MTQSNETQEAQRREAEEAVMFIATLEVECPDCILIDDKEGWGSGCICQGTGTVARFEGLRQHCKGVNWDAPKGYRGRVCIILQETEPKVDCQCHGLGYVLPPEAEIAGLLMEILLDSYPFLQIEKYELGIYIEERVYNLDHAEIDIRTLGKGPTLVAALAAAVAKAAG